MVPKEREIEIKGEVLKRYWKLLSKSGELGLTGAGKEIRGDDKGRRQVMWLEPSQPFLT